jgi:hypothetical protein
VFEKYVLAWTIAIVPIHIPSSLRNNISFWANFNQKTFDNIGNHKIIHNNQIAFSHESLIEDLEKISNNDKKARTNNIFDIFSLCLIINIHISSPILKNDNIITRIKKGICIGYILSIKIMYCYYQANI